MKERDEIILLCKELEELGGGISTRLEQVTVTTYQEGFLKQNVMRFLGLNYNATVVAYGAIGSGKSRLIFEEVLPELGGMLTEELDALFFLEAYEYSIDSKTATEKRRSLIQVPGKQAPEVVQFKTKEELDALLMSVKS